MEPLVVIKRISSIIPLISINIFNGNSKLNYKYKQILEKNEY
jgi:hypothetical protein